MAWKNIRWESTEYAGYRGVAGEFELVSLSWHSQKRDPKWLVGTRLPVVVPESLKGHDDLDKAKEMAEELIHWFLQTIGAEWSVEETED